MSGEADAHVPLRFLPQRLDVLDDELSVAGTWPAFAPGVSDNRCAPSWPGCSSGARRADQMAATLSGGERFRAALAALMLADPAPQLLCSTSRRTTSTGEPRQLVGAWRRTRARWSSVSHDQTFLE